MGDVIAFRRPSPADKHKGKTLCKHGRHKWEIAKDCHFDVKQGRLVTLYRCTRCGMTKTAAI